MRVQKPIRFTLLILTSLVLMLNNGCRSGMNGGESFWKRPNLSSFAFGKKKDDSVPKPPALHFDPTPANSEKTEVAAKSSATKNTTTDLQNSLNKLAKSDTEVSEKPVAKADQPVDGTQPLRTPYQVSQLAASKKTDNPAGTPVTKKQVAGLSNRVSQSDFKLPETLKPNASTQVASASRTAEQARTQFNNDMQNLNSTAKSNLGVVESNVGNSLKGLSPAGDKLAGVARQQGNGVGAAEKRLSEEQRRLEAEVAKAKQEIADLKTQLMANNQMLAPIRSAQLPSGSNLGTQSGTTQSASAPGSASQFNSPLKQDFQPNNLIPNRGFVSPNNVVQGIAQGNVSQSGFEPLRPVSNAGSSASVSATGPAAAKYPSTAHQGFSAAVDSTPTKPDTNIQRVELQTPLGYNGGEVDTQQDFGAATADIEIPESVLRGTGSFSPGSVNRLRGD